MGRLVDADLLREEVNSWGMNDYDPSDFTDAIDDAPTVEAIPKADYENRLKADLEAIFVELQLEIEEHEMTSGVTNQDTWNECIACCSRIIQQKINELKEQEDEIHDS